MATLTRILTKQVVLDYYQFIPIVTNSEIFLTKSEIFLTGSAGVCDHR